MQTPRTADSVKHSLNESPSEKEGKFIFLALILVRCLCLNESPSEKEGKLLHAAPHQRRSQRPQ